MTHKDTELETIFHRILPYTVEPTASKTGQPSTGRKVSVFVPLYVHDLLQISGTQLWYWTYHLEYEPVGTQQWHIRSHNDTHHELIFIASREIYRREIGIMVTVVDTAPSKR